MTKQVFTCDAKRNKDADRPGVEDVIYSCSNQGAKTRGRAVQVGTDMLFEMNPANLQFFAFGTTIPGELRAVSQPRH